MAWVLVWWEGTLYVAGQWCEQAAQLAWVTMDSGVSVSWVKGGSDKAQAGGRSVVTSGTVTVTSINVQDSQDISKYLTLRIFNTSQSIFNTITIYLHFEKPEANTFLNWLLYFAWIWNCKPSTTIGKTNASVLPSFDLNNLTTYLNFRTVYKLQYGPGI